MTGNPAESHGIAGLENGTSDWPDSCRVRVRHVPKCTDDFWGEIRNS